MTMKKPEEIIRSIEAGRGPFVSFNQEEALQIAELAFAECEKSHEAIRLKARAEVATLQLNMMNDLRQEGRRQLAEELLYEYFDEGRTGVGIFQALRAMSGIFEMPLPKKETAKASLVGNDHKKVGVGENPTLEGCNGLPAADIPLIREAESSVRLDDETQTDADIPHQIAEKVRKYLLGVGDMFDPDPDKGWPQGMILEAARLGYEKGREDERKRITKALQRIKYVSDIDAALWDIAKIESGKI